MSVTLFEKFVKMENRLMTRRMENFSIIIIVETGKTKPYELNICYIGARKT